MATLRSSSLAWEQGGAPSPQGQLEAGAAKKLPADVRVQIHGAFLIEVLNPDPVYTKCKDCKTKIDRESGACKRKAGGCSSTPGDETALSNVRLGDFTGGNVEMLADEEVLCKIAGVQDLQALKALVGKSGPQGLAFRTRCDVRVGANRIRARPGSVGNTQEAFASQAGTQTALHTPTRPVLAFGSFGSPAVQSSQTSPGTLPGSSTVLNEQCDWQVLLASTVLHGPWGAENRPAVQRVFSHGSDASRGQVLPVVSPCLAFVETAMGLQHETTKTRPDFVFTLCFATDEPSVERGDDNAVIVRHESVYPCRGDTRQKDDNEKFAVEANCTLSECCWHNMADKKPRFLVGTVRKCDERTAVIAERIFSVHAEQQALQNFQAECAAADQLLSVAVEQLPQKRSAESLIHDTPTKKSAKGLYGAEDKA